MTRADGRHFHDPARRAREERCRIGAGLGLGLGIAGVLVLAGGVGGCASPLQDRGDRDLRRSIRISAERELAEASERPDPIRLTREDRVGRLGIKADVIQQLEETAGPDSYRGKLPPLGVTLYGDEQQVAPLSLQQAILTAVGNNLNAEFARLGPAISQQQVVAAEAAFDWTFFVNSQYQNTDQPRTNSSVGGFVSGVDRDRRDVFDTTAGLRKALISGGQLAVQTEYQFTDNQTPGLSVNPNPAYDTNLVIQLTQPLLRNFGSDVQLANVRLARNTELDSILQLKGTLIQVVTDTETAYWNLVRAVADLQITQRLLERGEQVVEVLKAREPFDAKRANISDAIATVESRRTDVLRAQRALRDASDRLKVFVNDPRLPIGTETLIMPVDRPTGQIVEISLYDAMQSAISNRPEVQRAIISIDNTSVRKAVADNARLPNLNLQALSRFGGLGGTPGQSYAQLGEAQFIDYQIGVQFEQPIGNRAAEANYKGRRLEQEQAIVSYRNTIQGIRQELNNAMRDVQLNSELIEQTRTARIAAADNVLQLQIAEEALQGLTPEFLNLKLSRQQSLAAAEQQEISAIIDYNTAIARYHSATGTALMRNQVQFETPSLVPEARTSDLFPDWPTEKQRQRERGRR